MLTHALLSPPSIVAGDVAQQVAPLAQTWRHQAEVLTQENERLRAEIKRLEATQWRDFEVTAYTANEESTGKHPGDKDYGITASGSRVRAKYTIACPPDIPFGTVLEIENVGERVCEDRGGAIKGKRLDIYVAQINQAISFGRRNLKVKIKTR
jgi:3D (Asp-Asp-Asp) domain-containing protein